MNPRGPLLPEADFSAGRQRADVGRDSLPPHQQTLVDVRPRSPAASGPDRSASSRIRSGGERGGNVPPPPCTLFPLASTAERPNASDAIEDTEVGPGETLRSQTARLFLGYVLAARAAAGLAGLAPVAILSAISAVIRQPEVHAKHPNGFKMTYARQLTPRRGFVTRS